MSGAALQMKIIEDVRRLAALNLTDRAIARALKIDRRSVKKYRESPNCEATSHIPAKKAFLFSITLKLLQLFEIMTDLQFTEFFYRRL